MAHLSEPPLAQEGDFRRTACGLRDLRQDPSLIGDLAPLETKEALGPEGGKLDGITVHTNYLNDGTTSQYDLATVVAGYPQDAVYGYDIGLGDVERQVHVIP